MIIKCSLTLILLQIAALIGFMADMIVSTTEHQAMSLYSIYDTTYFCYQKLLYNYTDQNGKPYFSLNQEVHATIVNWITITVISIIFVCILCIYVYIAIVVASVNKRRKLSNNNYRFVICTDLINPNTFGPSITLKCFTTHPRGVWNQADTSTNTIYTNVLGPKPHSWN